MFKELIARIPEGYHEGRWQREVHTKAQWIHPVGKPLSYVAMATGDGSAEISANAALIALAPELATALRDAQAEIERLTEAAVEACLDVAAGYPDLPDDRHVADRALVRQSANVAKLCAKRIRAALAPKE